MFASKLKQESAITVGALEAAGIYLIYNNACPNIADIRSAMPHDSTIEGARKQAAYVSLALVGSIFALTKDLNALIIGCIAIIGIDSMHKHANGVNPGTGKLDTNTGVSISPSADTSYPAGLPDYADAGSYN